MNLVGLAAVIAAVALLVLMRRPVEHDVAGNPALRLRPPAMALLPIALLFFFEAFVYWIGPSFARHPATCYVLLAFGVLVLLAAALLFSLHVSLEPKCAVLQIPHIFRRTYPLSEFVEVQEDALIPIIVFTGERRLTLLPLFSGVEGFLGHLRSYLAELNAGPAARRR